jgi:hypothetical protein
VDYLHNPSNLTDDSYQSRMILQLFFYLELFLWNHNKLSVNYKKINYFDLKNIDQQYCLNIENRKQELYVSKHMIVGYTSTCVISTYHH